jgi:hypothetical protein
MFALFVIWEPEFVENLSTATILESHKATGKGAPSLQNLADAIFQRPKYPIYSFVVINPPY